MKGIVWLLLLAGEALAGPVVAVIAPAQAAGPGRYGVERLEQALRAKGCEITDSAAGAEFVLFAGLSADREVAGILREWKAPVPAGAEALTIWRGRYQGKTAAVVAGADAAGLMYAALDAAGRIGWSVAGRPLEYLANTTEKPYLAQRGISMYTMQRAYFESRLYDQRYWERYFDLLAASRINSFVVIFGYENGGFMAPLYPYFFNVDSFPSVELVGLTRAQQERNAEAFRTLIRTAHERGIAVTAGIWDHIYRGGVQGGGIPGASANAGKRVNGLVSGVTAENLAAYTKAGLRQFLQVFPEIDAIQFRMHDESGLKPEEIRPFWHDVFSSIKETHPALRLDLRAKGLPDEVIDDALSLGLNVKVSTKYWMEQMGLPFHPTHINPENQRERRHSFADLLRYPQRYRVHWQLWSGGTTRLLLWGDPDYVRRFARTARLYDGDSFEINEMLATKMLGEPHDAPPRGILNPAHRYYDYEFERYWHFYQLWGRLTYNPEMAGETWEREFNRRYGAQGGPHIMKALHLASRVLPRIVAASYRYQLFPTTRGWAEMMRQGSLAEYATEQGSDVQQFLSPREEARSIVQGTETAKRRPEETSRWFAELARSIQAEVAQAGGNGTEEFRVTVADLGILANLARYHSERLLAAVAYNLWKETGSLESFDDAVGHEKAAVGWWRQIVSAAGDIYAEDLAFGAHAVGFSRHWKEELELLEKSLAALQAERVAAVAKPEAKHFALPQAAGEAPAVRLMPAAADLTVRVIPEAPGAVKSVRLRYRHLTQLEDYQSVEMTFDPKAKEYSAQIPPSFLDPKWRLQYFVEVVGKNGSGRMYPDLETETPYVVR